jgi:capsular polysaccharide biosynthesis protein
MAEMMRTTDDEIDLIELFEILWKGKLFILTVTILATIVGFAYTQFTKPVYLPKYKIAVPYDYTITSIGTSNATKLGFIIDPNWVVTGAQFEQSDQKPEDPMAYLSALNNVNDILTGEVLAEAQAELAFMKIAMNEMVQLSSSETFMSNFLKVRRLIFKIESGVKVMRLGDVSINEIEPQPSKDNLKIALAFVLGLFASMAFVLIKNAFQQRRRLSK